MALVSQTVSQRCYWAGLFVGVPAAAGALGLGILVGVERLISVSSVVNVVVRSVVPSSWVTVCFFGFELFLETRQAITTQMVMEIPTINRNPKIVPITMPVILIAPESALVSSIHK